MALSDQPINRFDESEQAKVQSKTKSDAKSNKTRADIAARASAITSKAKAGANDRTDRLDRSASMAPSEEIVQNAREAAKAANTLEELKEALNNFDGCNLKRGAKNLVFADGNPNTKIIFVGKAPERDEDLNGIPFSGAAGALMDKMLAAIDLDRQQCYLMNIVPWHTPGGRPPTAPEVEICRPFVERHIELIKPAIIVTMGDAPTRTLLHKTDHVTRVRGIWQSQEIGATKADAIATLHPSHLLKQPAQKGMAWQDLLAIKDKLRKLNS